MAKLGGIYVSVRAKTDQYKRDLANAKTLTEKAAIVMQHKISSISFAQVGAAALAFGAIMTKVGLDGFRAVETMKLSTASLAATITSFAKDADKDLAGTYRQALNYSGQLVLKMEELNAQTVATGENLTAMVETMAQGGVLLDLNNEKQIKGFLAIANALALITQGQNQDIQFRQEIRGLINGEVRATNMLARLLSQRVGGELKKHVALWKEQGTLIESAGALLGGFQEGAKDLSNTWLAVGTTIRTMYDRTMRGLMLPVYEDIIKLGKQITLNVLDQNSALNRNATILKIIVYKGWQDIKNITESVTDVIAAFKTPLLLIGKVTGLILDGWGQIFAILPAITERLKLITQAIFDSVKMAYHFGEALWNLTTLNLKAAAQSWKAAKNDWTESGRKTAAAFSSGFGDEIFDRLAKYNKDLTVKAPKPVLPPELKTPTTIAAPSTSDLKKTADLYKELYQATGLEEYANKAIAANAKVVASSATTWSKVLKDDQAVNALRVQEKQKFHNELYAKEIAAQQKINESLASARKKDFDNSAALSIKAEEEKQATITEFSEQYGKNRFDAERKILDERAELLRAYGIDENEIKRMVSDENIRIKQEETSQILAQNQMILENTTSMSEAMTALWTNYTLNVKSEIQELAEVTTQMADSLASGIGNAYANIVVYGENLSSAFANLTKTLAAQVISSIVKIGVQRLIQWAASKVLGAAEATSRMGVLAAETYAGAFASTVAIPVVGPAMAPAVAGASTAAMLAGATAAGATGAAMGISIASYDSGGVSNARGVYQTGNIQEAHVPIPSGKIPVEINGGQEQKPTEITIMNSVDPQVMDAWAASSRGQSAIFNIIGSQPQRLRRLVR